MWLWIAANIISELLNAEIKREHMLEEFNFHWNFPHELEAELIDSIQSNKPPFLLVPSFLARRVVAGLEDVGRRGPKPKQRGCVNLVERVEERKNELAFFTRVGGRKVVLLNTLQLLSKEQNVYDRLWNFLWIWLIAWANITFSGRSGNMESAGNASPERAVRELYHECSSYIRISDLSVVAGTMR